MISPRMKNPFEVLLPFVLQGLYGTREHYLPVSSLC